MKKYLLPIITCMLVLVSSSLFSSFFRDHFLDKSKPFPTWTYSSPNKYLNALTSWDSGLYYAIAKNGYPKIEKNLPVASIKVPANSWTKVFLGFGIVGDKKFVLPTSNSWSHISNVVFLLNDTYSEIEIPFFNAYPGVPYCEYSGEIQYERDIKVLNVALSEATACGNFPCDGVYVSYYLASQSKVVFQETFDRDNIDMPKATKGRSRPAMSVDQEFEGHGCKTIGSTEITYTGSVNYKKEFTQYAFMPLYPFIARLASNILSTDIVAMGILVSFLAFVISAFYLYSLARSFSSEKQAFALTILYMLFPLSFFNVTFQAVSLFNLLMFFTLYNVIKGKFTLSLIGFVALVYTNLLGIFMIIPLYYLLERKLVRTLWYLLVLVIFLVPWVYFLYSKTGDWFALYNTKLPWYGESTSFVGSFVNSIFNFKLNLLAVNFVAIGFLILLSLFSYLSRKESSLPLVFLVTFLCIAVFNGGFLGAFKYYMVLLCGFVFLPLKYRPHSFSHILLYTFQIFLAVLWSLSFPFFY